MSVEENVHATDPGPALGEMRIALAMSGAIALVLYESGVAHEIHGFLNKKGPYAEALDLARLRPIVDILTGASAGGINSVFLADCFVNGAEFEDFTSVWIETAGVDSLRYGEYPPPKSILDSAILRKKMGEIFKSHVQAKRSHQAELPIQRIGLKVRICRTDLRGYCVSTLDAAGHRIDVQSRSDVLAYDNAAFSTDNPQDIIDAAAATSAFPLAFPAVFNKRWYVDGGLWNNQPIDLAVEAIRDKAAFSRTHRCVLFVDPEPAILAEEDDPSLPPEVRLEIQRQREEYEQGKPPSPLETVAFVPGLGVKGSVLPAIDTILDYNSRIELYQQALNLDSLLGNLSQIAQEVSSPQGDKGKDAFTKLSLLDQARIQTVLLDNDPKLLQIWFAIRERCPRYFPILVDEAVGVLNRIEEADLYRRAIRRELKDVNEKLKTTRNPYDFRDRKGLLYAGLWKINKILETEPSNVNDFFGTSVAYREHRRERISTFWPASVSILYRIAKAMNGPDEELARAFEQAKGEWAKALPATIHFDRPVEIQDVDRVRYVLATFSDLDEKRRVDLVRISPNDTNNLDLIGEKTPQNQTPAALKLAGEKLGHLTGFLEERWRRNDYVWGRLDAAEILLRTLRTYAGREATSLGVENAFTEEAHRRILTEVQTAILREEARRYAPRDGKGTNPASGIQPDRCGAVSGKDAQAAKEIVRENRKIIGFGQEDLSDATDPQFKRNLSYILSTSLVMFRVRRNFFTRFLVSVATGYLNRRRVKGRKG